MSDAFEFSLDKSRIDVVAAHALLSTAYWSRGIPIETVTKAIANSICAGAYDAGGTLVGFARLVTDEATFGYLCDVIVVPPMQGRGLAKRLVGLLLAQDCAAGLRRIVLATRDAHSLYAPFGFEALAAPASFMEIVRPSIYEGTQAPPVSTSASLE